MRLLSNLDRLAAEGFEAGTALLSPRLRRDALMLTTPLLVESDGNPPTWLVRHQATRTSSTSSRRSSRSAAADLRSGIVGINDYNCSRCETPFGGIGDSGWGQEGGLEGIEPYLVKKAILNI